MTYLQAPFSINTRTEAMHIRNQKPAVGIMSPMRKCVSAFCNRNRSIRQFTDDHIFCIRCVSRTGFATYNSQHSDFQARQFAKAQKGVK